jgi:hypothetical protein
VLLAFPAQAASLSPTIVFRLAGRKSLDRYEIRAAWIDIVDLGFIKDISVRYDHAKVDMVITI